jgi:trimeric autotransporter adhesin
MKPVLRLNLTFAPAWLVFLTLNFQLSIAHAQGTAFTYQGQLVSGGAPANGSYDLTFTLYATNITGTASAGPVTNCAVSVSSGLFTTTIDFGAGAFTGTSNWLEISASTNGANNFITLAPRQQLTPIPYAIFSSTAGNVNGLQIQPNTSGAPNFIGGSPGNYVLPGVVGAVIGGGGATDYYGDNNTYSNNVSGDFGTVGGGRANTISQNAILGTIGGGDDNNIAYGSYATISGGSENSVDGGDSTVGGGDNNDIQKPAIEGTIAGGGGNIIEAVPLMRAPYDSTIGGGSVNTIEPGNYATVSGGVGNTIQFNNGFGISGGAATIGGGSGNLIGTNSDSATIAGGDNNTIGTNAAESVIAGGGDNTISSNAYDTIIGGGSGNTASAAFSTVSGGQQNTASAEVSVIGGGSGNTASGVLSTIAGGGGNIANGSSCTIAGGQANEVSGLGSTVGGGKDNSADGDYSTVPGGHFNVAVGEYSFAAGQRAQAFYQGDFVWADSQGTFFPSTANDQFLIRAQGGVGINTNNPNGAALFVNGTIVASGTVTANGVVLTSDRNAKENFAALDAETVLTKVTLLPVTEWNYKDEGAARKHIGPMAQDFHTAFGLNGADDKHISVVDEGGVALAAIQGLDQKVESGKQKTENQIEELKGENADLKKQNDLLAQRLNELEQTVKTLAVRN